MIHISAINTIIQTSHDDNEEYDIVYISKSSGRLISGRIICTSTNFERRTMNIKFVSSGQQRTVRTCLIIEFNGIPVFI